MVEELHIPNLVKFEAKFFNIKSVSKSFYALTSQKMHEG